MFEHKFSGRYSELLEEVLEELGVDKVLREDFEDDWQGYVDVDVLLNDGRIYSYKYWYGSCSGCDDWESDGLPDDNIKTIMKNATYFGNIEQYEEWRNKCK